MLVQLVIYKLVRRENVQLVVPEMCAVIGQKSENVTVTQPITAVISLIFYWKPVRECFCKQV